MSILGRSAHSGLLRASAGTSTSAVSFTRPAATFLSTSACQKRASSKRHKPSALRGTGLGNQKTTLTLADLPMPVYDPAKRTKPETNPNHGLWGFFNEQKSVLTTPKDESKHGRGWHAEELRHKSWADLHHLWWSCCRERNRIRTENHSRTRISAGFGENEANEREEAAVKTMRTIRAVLIERWYAWNEAYDMAQNDPEIEFSEDSSGKLKVTYTPMEDMTNLEGLDPETQEALLLEQQTAAEEQQKSSKKST